MHDSQPFLTIHNHSEPLFTIIVIHHELLSSMTIDDMHATIINYMWVMDEHPKERGYRGPKAV